MAGDKKSIFLGEELLSNGGGNGERSSRLEFSPLRLANITNFQS